MLLKNQITSSLEWLIYEIASKYMHTDTCVQNIHLIRTWVCYSGHGHRFFHAFPVMCDWSWKRNRPLALIRRFQVWRQWCKKRHAKPSLTDIVVTVILENFAFRNWKNYCILDPWVCFIFFLLRIIRFHNSRGLSCGRLVNLDFSSFARDPNVTSSTQRATPASSTSWWNSSKALDEIWCVNQRWWKGGSKCWGKYRNLFETVGNHLMLDVM